MIKCNRVFSTYIHGITCQALTHFFIIFICQWHDTKILGSKNKVKTENSGIKRTQPYHRMITANSDGT